MPTGRANGLRSRKSSTSLIGQCHHFRSEQTQAHGARSRHLAKRPGRDVVERLDANEAETTETGELPEALGRRALDVRADTERRDDAQGRDAKRFPIDTPDRNVRSFGVVHLTLRRRVLARRVEWVRHAPSEGRADEKPTEPQA